MKKQLLAAAVAASMATVATADISISGVAKANVTNGNSTIEADIKIVGKADATSVVANLSLDKGMNKGSASSHTTSASGVATATDSTATDAMVEDLYLTSSFEGINIKAGEWRSGKSELDQTSTAVTRYNLSTKVGGVGIAFEDNGTTSDVTVSGSIAGVSVKHKIKNNANSDSETWISGSVAGVDFAWNEEDTANVKSTATTLGATVGGIGIKYVKIDSDEANGVASDGYVGKGDYKDASALGVSASVAGNKVTIKAIDEDGTDSNKVILTRPMSGATFEATYTDKDGNNDTLDLELAVKF